MPAYDSNATLIGDDLWTKLDPLPSPDIRAWIEEQHNQGIFELQCGDDGSPVSAYPVAAFASEAEARRIDDFVRRRIKGYGSAQRPAPWVPFEDLR